MKDRERRRAIKLLRRHPGWSDRRIGRELDVAHTTISRWRWEEGLAPALKQVRGRRERERLADHVDRVSRMS
jgi:transposase